MPFQVLALPRSQTLWLSMLLDRPGVTCLHEGLSYFADTLPDIPGQIVGSVDTCPLFYKPQTEYPVVVIDSIQQESRMSVIKNFDPPFGMDEEAFVLFMFKSLNKFQNYLDSIQGENVFRVTRSWLRDVTAIKEISNHLTPGVELDTARIEKYLDTRIKTMNRNIEPHICAIAGRYDMSGEQYVWHIMEHRDAS